MQWGFTGGDARMQVASYLTAEGESKLIDYADGRFSVDGSEMTHEQVMAWDAAGMLAWTQPETREWARNLGVSPNRPVAPEQKKPKVRRIQETRYTCSACGNVWHMGKQEQLEASGAAMSKCGKSMMCCGGCAPALVIPDKKVVQPGQCPKCGSRASKSEIVTHEVE